MLMKWIRVFFIIVLIAAVFGFMGIPVAQPILSIVRIIFGIFLVLFIMTIFMYIWSDKEKKP